MSLDIDVITRLIDENRELRSSLQRALFLRDSAGEISEARMREITKLKDVLSRLTWAADDLLHDMDRHLTASLGETEDRLREVKDEAQGLLDGGAR